MQTRFDDITDKEIFAALPLRAAPIDYPLEGETEIGKIARFACDMYYWKCWLGPPVTFFDESGLNYDGHHRVRACKYIARVLGFQVHIPVRYDPVMREENYVPGIPQKQYRAPCSQDCVCHGSSSGVSESLCK